MLGLGYAAARDVGAFLKNREADDAGTANPVYRAGNKAILMGTSQSGRYVRSFIQLGFNQDEDGRQAFEGAYPHIGGGLMPLNVRFGQPGRAWGDQVDHLYPAYDFPFTYARQRDPLTGREQGVLDRCQATNTCPLIFHVATALEMWEGPPVARPDRSARPPRRARSGQCAHLHPGEHAARRRATAASERAAVRHLPAAAQSQSAHLDHAGACSRRSPAGSRTAPAACERRAAHRRRLAGRAGPGAPAGDPGDQLQRSRAPGAALSRCAQSAARARLRPALSAGRYERRDHGRAAARQHGHLRRAGAAGRCRRQRHRRRALALCAGAARHLYGLELRPQGPVRGRLLLAAGQLHPVRRDPAGAARSQGPAPLDRGALSRARRPMSPR